MRQGAVDLASGMEKVLKDFDGKVQRQQVIVYIGDAESAAAPLSEKERYQLANKVREAKVQFFAVPIGASINALNMHSLVTGTGGSVARFAENIKDPRKAVSYLVKELNATIDAPVLFPTKVQFGAEVAERYPSRLPPLRGDAPTLVVGKFLKGKTPAKFEGEVEGRIGGAQASVSFSEVVPAPETENFFLSTIVRQWSEAGHKDAPAILRADRTLALAFEQGRMTRDEYLTQAQWALGANQVEAAKNLSDAAQRLDPNNAEVKALCKVVSKIEKGEMTLEKLKHATGNRIGQGVKFEKGADGRMIAQRVDLRELADDAPPAPKAPNAVPTGDPKALLRSEEARRAIIEQQVDLTVSETLSRGRELLRNADPKGAKDLVLAQRESIRSNPDIGDALRTKLLTSMDNLLTEIGQRGESLIRKKAEESERLARAQAKLMIADTLEDRENRTRNRIKAFTNLMSQARFEDAYREALVMNQEFQNEGRPIPIESQAVYQLGQAATNLREMRELIRIREDRFMLTMMQVEKSHIPYPDEPPVHFPPSKVWRDLQDLRKRYSANDFEGDIPARVRRRMEFLKSALENPITEIDKGDLPLPFLLETVSALASPAGADKDPSRKVTILIDVDAFNREAMGMGFDPEKKSIKFQSKLVGVSASTVLRLICEQLDATYWVRRDYIEIVPASMAIREKVIRVFPVEDLIIGIPNAINQSALQQSLAVLGQTFSLGGGFTGAPVAINGNMGALGFGGFQFGGMGIGGAGGGAGGFQGAAGGLFQGRGGIAGFAGGIQGNIGNQLGGQFGFQGADYGPILVQLITSVVAQGEWTINNKDVIGGGAQPGGMDPDPADGGNAIPPELLNKIGYWPPARALVITGTSRIHRNNSSKLPKKPGEMGVNFAPGKNQANAGGNNKPPVNDAGGKVVAGNSKPAGKIKPANADAPADPSLKDILAKHKNLDPEAVYQAALDKGMTKPGEVIACVDFLVNRCNPPQYKHAAELLKAGLRTGITADPWAQETLAIALEGSQGSAEEIERARLSSIDLAPRSPHGYLKAAQAMADMGNPDRAVKFCEVAARLEPSMPDPYVNGLVYASSKKATLQPEISGWMADKLLSQDWTTDTGNFQDYHFRAREHLIQLVAKLKDQKKDGDAKKVQEMLDNSGRRDLIIQLLWSGESDLDLKVREPVGSTCSSLNKQTSGGGILLCDDFTQKVDNRSETYTAAQAFDGIYQVSVNRVWGRSLGERATIKVIRNQGTPDQTIEIHTLDLKKQTSMTIALEGGRRHNLAAVLPMGTATNSMLNPKRETEVMDKLRAMTSGVSVASSGMTGGTGHAGTMGDPERPLMEMAVQSSVSSMVPGGMEMQKETTVFKDHTMSVKMLPVFQSVGTSGQTKLKLDFIPGAE
jgi:hypothetical protein